MERNLKGLGMVGGATVYLDPVNVVMLEPVGEDTRAVLVTGTEFVLAGDPGSVEAVLGQMRLRGVNGYRINPDHVLALETTGRFACRLHLSASRVIEVHGISAADISRAIERQDKYPWDTIRMTPSAPRTWHQ